MSRRQIFLYAFRKSIPVMLGYIFLGIAFGIVLNKAGYAWPWALAMSVLIFAGSMQFALVPLVAAFTPLPTVALMTLLVNCRHIFYGLSFVETFKRMGRRYPYMIFSLSDETYSVLCACREDPEFRERDHLAAFYIGVLDQSYWVLGSVIGAIGGSLLAFDTTGIDFSMTALFVVILVDQIRNGGTSARIAAGIGIAVALIALMVLGADSFLLPTLIVTVAILAIMSARAEREAA